MEGLKVLLLIGALIFSGVLCTFLIFLNTKKEEIWNEIYNRYFNNIERYGKRK